LELELELDEVTAPHELSKIKENINLKKLDKIVF